MTVYPPFVYSSSNVRKRAHTDATAGVRVPNRTTRKCHNGPAGRRWDDRSGLDLA